MKSDERSLVRAKPRMHLLDQLCYATTRIETKDATGNVSSGTGYFISFPDVESPLLVTNKHVIQGAVLGTVAFCLSDSDGNLMSGRFEQITTADFEGLWVHHPDPEVDLCASAVGNFLGPNRVDGAQYCHKSIGQDLFFSDDHLVGAGESILMIGYPIGLWDSRNNMPLFRQGITSTSPNLDYEGKKEFLIDAACFPGSSGSPVLLHQNGAYVDRRTQSVTIGKTRVFLLGTLYAGPQYTAKGRIEIRPVPTQHAAIPITRIPMNLGFVIKAQQLSVFRDLFRIHQ